MHEHMPRQTPWGERNSCQCFAEAWQEVWPKRAWLAVIKISIDILMEFVVNGVCLCGGLQMSSMLNSDNCGKVVSKIGPTCKGQLLFCLCVSMHHFYGSKEFAGCKIYASWPGVLLKCYCDVLHANKLQIESVLCKTVPFKTCLCLGESMQGLSQNVLYLQMKGVLLLMTNAGTSSCICYANWAYAYVSQQCIYV